MADDLPLLLRVFDAGQFLEKPLLGVYRYELDAEVSAEGPLDLLPLVQAQQARVDENAGELIADGAVDERCRDRGIDSPR